MNLIMLVLTLAIVGLVLWLIEKYIPMDPIIVIVIRVVVVIAIILWLIRFLGISLPDFHVGR